tara:strand:- start:69 stop:677 length:609 start_codon:yes stop_codon:yes gene_type:complete
MFGFSLKSKVKKVLWEDFRYEPPKLYEPLLDFFLKNSKNLPVNKYDIAIMYMIYMMNILSRGGSEQENFIKVHTANVERVLSLAISSYDEIKSLLNLVKNKNKSDEFYIPNENIFIPNELKSDNDTPKKKIKQKGYFFSLIKLLLISFLGLAFSFFSKIVFVIATILLYVYYKKLNDKRLRIWFILIFSFQLLNLLYVFLMI